MAHSTAYPAGMAPLSQMTCGICKGMDITDLAQTAEALKRSFLTPFPQAEVGRQWRPRRALFQMLDFTNGAMVHAALFLHVEGDPDPRPSSSPCRDWGAAMMPSTIEAGWEELWSRHLRAWEQVSRQGKTRTWHMSHGDVWQDSIERTTDPFTLALRLQVSQHGPPNQHPAAWNLTKQRLDAQLKTHLDQARNPDRRACAKLFPLESACLRGNHNDAVDPRLQHPVACRCPSARTTSPRHCTARPEIEGNGSTANGLGKAARSVPGR